jgi:hypothetical protein
VKVEVDEGIGHRGHRRVTWGKRLGKRAVGFPA